MESSICKRAWRRLICQMHLDLGSRRECLIVNGLGRSGTTWVGNILQSLGGYRSLFEPFFPAYVPSATPLGYFPYFGDSVASKEQVQIANRILSGRMHGKWVDRDNGFGIYRRRLIKDIRSSYMLPWLKQQMSGLKLIIVVRDPVSVYHSWLKLGWIGNRARAKEIFALHSLIENESFCRNYPEWAEYGRGFSTSVDFDAFLFDWFTSILIPLIELDSEDYVLLDYDALKADPVSTLKPILRAIGESPISDEGVIQAAGRNSSTHFLANTKSSKYVLNSGERDCAERAASFFVNTSLESLFSSKMDVLLSAAKVQRGGGKLR